MTEPDRPSPRNVLPEGAAPRNVLPEGAAPRNVLREGAALRLVLHEGAGSRRLDGARRFEILAALLGEGYAVSCPANSGEVAPADTSDVLVLAELDDPGGGTGNPAAASGGPAEGVVATGNGDLENVDVHVRDVRGSSREEIVEIVNSVQRETQTYRNDGWKPWFPVIDFQRCTNCMQCLSFCLFDVYGVDAESQIAVKNPDKCKTNCPACSRVCPEVAILFPKYGSGPINGDEVDPKDVEREKMKVDISALLGGDIYSLLRDRHARASTRFSKERDEQKALKERMRCLKKLQSDLDIPAEVLMALPTPDQILAKAGRARQAEPDGEEGQDEAG